MNMMKQAGINLLITNQQTMTARNYADRVLKQTDKQFYMKPKQRTQSAREYDSNVLAPFKSVLATRRRKIITCICRERTLNTSSAIQKTVAKFDGKTDHVPPGLSSDELESYNDTTTRTCITTMLSPA